MLTRRERIEAIIKGLKADGLWVPTKEALMPWTARDAYRHTKKASTPHLQSQWSKVANSALEGGADEASAIRQANAAVSKDGGKPKRKRSPK